MAEDATEDEPMEAGSYAGWLRGMERALAGDASSDVPCGSCTACCRASQFIHVGPDETDALAHIPEALRFPAPRLPPGHVVMGYDEQGHCPMLVDDRCSIYEHRPRTCRTYDCRVFPATEIQPSDPSHVEIRRRADRWRFSVDTDADRSARRAVVAAARHLAFRAAELPDELRTSTDTQRAVLAVRIHRDFLAEDERMREWPDS